MTVALDRRSIIIKALARRRQLAQTEFGQFGAKLTESLEALADHAAELRDWGVALAALEELVAVTRKLAVADPQTFRCLLSAQVLRSPWLFMRRAILRERLPRPARRSIFIAGSLPSGPTLSAMTLSVRLREAVAEHRKLNASLERGDACNLAWSLGLLSMRLRLAGNTVFTYLCREHDSLLSLLR